MFSIKKVAMAALLMAGTVFAAGPAMACLYEADVTISNLADVNLSAFNIDVSYDESLLTFESYTLTEELGSIDDFEAEDISSGDGYAGIEYVGAGTANISLFSWFDPDADFFDSQSDDFVLVTLIFSGVEGLESTLEDIYLSMFELSDEYGDAISCAVDGTDISVSAVPVPGAIWLMGSALLGLVGVRRRASS